MGFHHTHKTGRTRRTNQASQVMWYVALNTEPSGLTCLEFKAPLLIRMGNGSKIT